jgi:hypothetical protein
MEASGQGLWFERLLEELRLELRRGDAEQIRAKRDVRVFARTSLYLKLVLSLMTG